MGLRRFIPALAVLLGVLLAASAARAQKGAKAGGGKGGGAHTQPQQSPKPDKGHPEKGPHPVEELLHMSPQQRQQALSHLPEDRRRKIQTERLMQQYERFRQLPPERQQAVRKAMQKLQNQPPDRQQAIRQELNHLRAMPAAEREEHLSSEDVKSRYSKHEREILEDLSDALPPGE